MSEPGIDSGGLGGETEAIQPIGVPLRPSDLEPARRRRPSAFLGHLRGRGALLDTLLGKSGLTEKLLKGVGHASPVASSGSHRGRSR